VFAMFGEEKFGEKISSANSTNFDKLFFQFCQYLNTRKLRKKTQNKTKQNKTSINRQPYSKEN
jgi:hypothetical protein